MGWYGHLHYIAMKAKQHQCGVQRYLCVIWQWKMVDCLYAEKPLHILRMIKVACSLATAYLFILLLRNILSAILIVPSK